MRIARLRQPGGLHRLLRGRETSLLLATHEGVLDRAIDCWGGRITRRTAPPDERRPEVVVERLDRFSCPLLGVFGAEDPNPNADDLEELRTALEASGREHKLIVYEGAGHAFFADYRPTWCEEPAHVAWAEFLRLLEPLKTSDLTTGQVGTLTAPETKDVTHGEDGAEADDDAVVGEGPRCRASPPGEAPRPTTSRRWASVA